MVEFVSYDGDFPNLCSGTLVLRIDGEEVTFPKYCMRSGGSVWFDDEWHEHVESGEWYGLALGLAPYTSQRLAGSEKHGIPSDIILIPSPNFGKHSRVTACLAQ